MGDLQPWSDADIAAALEWQRETARLMAEATDIDALGRCVWMVETGDTPSDGTTFGPFISEQVARAFAREHLARTRNVYVDRRRVLEHADDEERSETVWSAARDGWDAL